MPYAKASTPTNIGQSNPPNQLPTYHFASLLNKTHTQILTSSCHALYTILHRLSPPTPQSTHNAVAAKSNAVFHTQLSLIVHLSAHPVWQYTLNVTQPSMNQQTVSTLHCQARTPANSLLKRNTEYQLNNKMTQCSTYTTPDLPPALAARPALCKAIHSNKYRPVKSA